MEKQRAFVKSTETSKLAGELMKMRYREGRERQEAGGPVVWAGTDFAGPGRVLHAAMWEQWGVVFLYPENYGALCAARGVAADYIDSCLSRGYSNLVCGYGKAVIGYAHKMVEEMGGDIPSDAPGRGMAKPALMLSQAAPCDNRNLFLRALQHYYDVPYYLMSDVLVHAAADRDFGELNPYYAKYMAEEMRSYVDWAGKQLGKKLDTDRLSENVDIALKSARLWYECDELRKAIPSPMPSEDHFACVAVGFFFFGEQQGLDFWQKLRDELKYRVDNKIGVIPDEKYRVMWVGLPAHHSIRVFNWLETLGVVGAIEAVDYHAGAASDPSIPKGITDPYERLAWWHVWYVTTWSAKSLIEKTYSWRAQRYLDWAREYKIDGALLHMMLSCRQASVGSLHIRDVLMKYANVPSLIVEGDLIDPRLFPEKKFHEEALAFLETMETYKRIREQEG